MRRWQILHTFLGSKLPAWTALGAVSAALLTVSAPVSQVAPMAATNHIPPVAQAARWLGEQMVGGLIPVGSPNPQAYYAESVDASIDAALAMWRAGGFEAEVAEIAAAVEANVQDYDHPRTVGVGQAFLAGPTAKAAALAFRTGGSPTNVGPMGADLIADIRASVASTDPIAGRIEDRFVDTDLGDMIEFTGEDRADVVGLAWAIDALKRWEDTSPANGAGLADQIADMTDYLQAQQCVVDTTVTAAGAFRATFTQNRVAPDQTCDGAASPSGLGARVTAEVALILQDLEADGLLGAELDSVLDDAIDWLQLIQQPSGAFFDTVRNGELDAVTAAMATLALARAGDSARAGSGARWLRSVQWFTPVPCAAAEVQDAVGAVAPSKDEFTQFKASGPGVSLPWRRATASAIPALAHAAYVPGPPALSLPTGFVHAKSRVTLQITQPDQGERLCVWGPRIDGRPIPVNETVEEFEIVAPPGSADRVYRVVAMDGTHRAVLRVLDATKLRVHKKFRSVPRGAKQKLGVSGLAPGEKVRIRVNGRMVAKGKANDKGKFKVRFKVRTRTGIARVKVRGRFDDRTGRIRFLVR